MEALNPIYQNGEYLENNPSWHIEDSPWKASKVIKALKLADLKPNTLCEIGCGAGEILNQLQQQLPTVNFVGYEISEAAYRMCLTRQKNGLSFRNEDLLEETNTDFFDVLLAIDVFEHVEDYYLFLRKCREKATYTIFHIPLDLSVQSVYRSSALLEERRRVGHIHYFTKETALESLRYAGFDIVAHFYTCRPMELPHRRLKKKLINGSRKLLSDLNPDLAARLLGGFSMMVVAKA